MVIYDLVFKLKKKKKDVPYVSLVNYNCVVLGLKAPALMNQCVEKSAEVRPSVEEGPLSEQQLGLRQAEERLYRDYIHRLLKVGRHA